MRYLHFLIYRFYRAVKVKLHSEMVLAVLWFKSTILPQELDRAPYKAVVRLSHSQHGDLCYHCEYVTVRYYARVKSSSSRKLGFDSYKRRRKVDEHKKLVCCHCHRHHHHHHQKQDAIGFFAYTSTPQDCPGPIVWNGRSRKKYLLISSISRLQKFHEGRAKLT